VLFRSLQTPKLQTIVMDDDFAMLFVGNIHGDCHSQAIKEFLEYGGCVVSEDSGSIDLKVGYAFVKCVNQKSLADSVRNLNHRTIPGFESRPVSVEFTKASYGEMKKREIRRKQSLQPTDCLFVVGFDPLKTKGRDIEHEFGSVARLKRVEMIKSFAHVYLNSIADATLVLEKYNGRELYGRVLTIEYKLNNVNNSAPTRGGGRDEGYRGGGDRDRRPRYDSRDRKMSYSSSSRRDDYRFRSSSRDRGGGGGYYDMPRSSYYRSRSRDRGRRSSPPYWDAGMPPLRDGGLSSHRDLSSGLSSHRDLPSQSGGGGSGIGGPSQSLMGSSTSHSPSQGYGGGIIGSRGRPRGRSGSRSASRSRDRGEGAGNAQMW